MNSSKQMCLLKKYYKGLYCAKLEIFGTDWLGELVFTGVNEREMKGGQDDLHERCILPTGKWTKSSNLRPCVQERKCGHLPTHIRDFKIPRPREVVAIKIKPSFFQSTYFLGPSTPKQTPPIKALFPSHLLIIHSQHPIPPTTKQ
jgi:hypothetical protein